MSKLLFMLFFCAVDLSIQTYTRSKCPVPEIEHGFVRKRQGNRLARFGCNPHYDLVGNKYANCRFGQWDVQLPVCVRAGCDDIEIDNGVSLPSHRGAWMMFYCFPGFKLIGSLTLYCNGYKWNATTPKCVPEQGSEPQLSCDFESEDLCGWRQDEFHDFDWSRLNTKTPSAFLFTGPSYDHTLGKGKSGYYMFIESTSRLTNDSARLVSPVYDSSLTENGCFSFFYHMYGKSIGGLRVYQIPEGLHQMHVNLTWTDKQDFLLFEKWGDLGDVWFRNVSRLTKTTGNFQIVIEGLRGTSFTSDIAIDDVAILQGADCDTAAATAVTPSEYSESCAGRCDVFGAAPPTRGCACTAACVADGDCCPDFLDLCTYNGPDQPDDNSPTSDQPLTEKLVRTSSTKYPTMTTSSTDTTSTTTTTQRPTTTTTTTTSTTTTTTTTKRPTTTSTTTTRKPTTRTLKTTTRTNPTTRLTTNTTTRVTTTKPTTTTRSTIRVTTQKATKTTRNTYTTQSDAMKAKMEQGIQRKVVAEKASSSSGTTAAVVTTLLLSALIVLAAVSLRSARGRAAIAKLRGRAAHDSEVRFLTRDDE